MNNDSISREALKDAIMQEVYKDRVGVFVARRIFKLIDNAPTVEPDCLHCKQYQGGYDYGFNIGYNKGKKERPQDRWGKWSVSEIQCPNCLEYFQTDCYSKEELNKCPICGAEMRKGNDND